MNSKTENLRIKKQTETGNATALADEALDAVVGGAGSGQPTDRRNGSANGFIFSDETYIGVRANQER